MSIQVMNSVWKHSKATGRTKLVLLAIADHQGEQGAWPSVATLAEMVGASERSIKRDIQDLQGMGELSVSLQQAPMNGRYKTNLYWVTLEGVTGWHASTQGVTAQVTRGDSSGNLGVTGSGTQTTIRNLKETGAEKTIYEPSKEMNDSLAAKFPGVDLRQSYEAFMDWVASKGVTYKDWDAAFRNWVRKDYSWSPQSNQQKNAQETRSYLDKSLEQTAAYLAEQKEQEKHSAPPPKCQHGKLLVLCNTCLRELG